MLNFQSFGKNPTEESLIKLKLLSKDAKESLKRIDDASLNPWVEMCDEMIKYVNNLEQGNYQTSLNHDFKQVAEHYQGFANESANESIDFNNVDWYMTFIIKVDFKDLNDPNNSFLSILQNNNISI
jgi:hypothetical protein